jgi:tetratricopeptide (TPR) repeat protein
MDDCVALLYSYSLVQPKLAAHAFSIHSLVHFWGRERLEIKERMATMLMAFNSLVHSPYQSSGDGEIYKVSPEDFKFQRSAVQHLEYALEVGDEAIGYWNLRYSADSLGLSDRRMRNYVFDAVDEVFGGLGSFPDYPKPRAELIRFSTVRPLRTEVAKSEMASSLQDSMDTLKNIWTMISSIPAILWEQGKLRLSLRWQLRTLSYIFTYSPTAFNAIMTPDRFNEQVPISILASTLVLQNLGETRAAERLVVFLRETYAIRYPMPQNLQLQAKMTHDRVNRQLGRVPASQDEELDMESIMAALSFTRAKKHEDDRTEQMNLVFESAETLANSLLRKEDFACVDIFRQIKTKRAEELPNGEVDYSLSCYNLGNALRLKGAIQGNKDSLREARDLFQEAITRLTVLLGESDYRKVRCIFALGSTYIYLGDFVLAEQHLSQTMIAYKDVPDATVYDKIGCLEKLSDARAGMKKYAMAAEGFFRCWKQRVLRLGVDHAESLQAMISWARCLYHLGSEGSAFLLFVGALERKRAQGQFDRRTQEAVAYLLRVVRERDSGSEGRKGNAIRERYILDFAQSVNAKGLPAELRASH